MPSSPSSHGLHTRTDHSSLAFSSTRPLPEANAKFPVTLCGSPACTGRQFDPAGAGSLENAVFSTPVTPLDTVVPTPVNAAGRPISAIAATQATTIHRVPSMVRVARLRISPCQASQIAPRITTGAR